MEDKKKVYLKRIGKIILVIGSITALSCVSILNIKGVNNQYIEHTGIVADIDYSVDVSNVEYLVVIFRDGYTFSLPVSELNIVPRVDECIHTNMSHIGRVYGRTDYLVSLEVCNSSECK